MVCIHKQSIQNRIIKLVLVMIVIYGTLRLTSCDLTNCLYHTMLLVSILIIIDMKI